MSIINFLNVNTIDREVLYKGLLETDLMNRTKSVFVNKVSSHYFEEADNPFAKSAHHVKTEEDEESDDVLDEEITKIATGIVPDG